MSNPLVAAYRYTSNNWALIGGSKVCGCCNCVEVFAADEIVAWTGLDMTNADDAKAVEKQTAMCPRCGSEAVLGDKAGYLINAQFLTQMNEAWFQKTLIRPTRPKA
ncbi:MAG: cytoplasmic protein [Cytophagales bacterium]|nr:cytoplasmic protein [Rhizobacter sp.]